MSEYERRGPVSALLRGARCLRGPPPPPRGRLRHTEKLPIVAVLPSTDYGAATAIGRQCRDGFLQSLWHHYLTDHYHYTQCSQRSLVSLGGG